MTPLAMILFGACCFILGACAGLMVLALCVAAREDDFPAVQSDRRSSCR